MTCPRCGAAIVEHEPCKEWLRYFRCEECLVDWHYFMGQLHQGKMRRPMGQEGPIRP